VKEATPGAENKNQSSSDRYVAESVSNGFGSLDYDYLEGSENQNPVFIFPGYPLGTSALRPFAAALNDRGREVIAPNRIELKSASGKSTINKEAELFARVIENEGLQHIPLDIVAHSYGALLFEEVAKLAAERGWTCFKEERGAHAVLVAPAGTNDQEKIRKFVPRYVRFFQLGAPRDKVLDKDKVLFKENTKVILGDLRKTVGEVKPILTDKINYINLGKIASKPYVLEYPQDSLFPYKVMDKTIFPEGLEGDESLVKSVSTPVELSEDLGKTLKQMDGDKERYYRTSHTARHDDLVFNPEATAEAFFKVIEDPDDRLDRLRQAAKNI